MACGGQATHRPGGRRGEGGLGRWGSQRVQQSVERMAGMGAAAAVSHFLPHIHGAPVPTSVVPPPPDLASALNPSPREWVLRGGLCPSPCPRHSSPRSPCLPHLQGRCGDPQARPGPTWLSQRLPESSCEATRRLRLRVVPVRSQSNAGDGAGPAVPGSQLARWALPPGEKPQQRSRAHGWGVACSLDGSEGEACGPCSMAVACLNRKSREAGAVVWDSGGRSLSDALPGSHAYPGHRAEKLTLVALTSGGAQSCDRGGDSFHPGALSTRSWERASSGGCSPSGAGTALASVSCRSAQSLPTAEAGSVCCRSQPRPAG